MKIILDTYAWVSKQDLSEAQLASLRKSLTLIPHRIVPGKGEEEEAAPIHLYAENEQWFGMAREWYLARRKPDHEVVVRSSTGLMSAWPGPLEWNPAFVLRDEQQEALRVISTAFKSGARHGGLLRAKPGWGKCLTGDTWVATSDGLRTLEELVPSVGDDLVTPLSARVFRREQQYPATLGYFRREAETLRLRTTWGYEVTGTPEHPVLTLRGAGPEWVPLSDLRPGDPVAVESYALGGAPVPIVGDYGRLRMPATVTPEMSRLLGYLVGDGGLTVAGRTTFSNADPQIIGDAHDLFLSIGLRLTRVPSSAVDWRTHSKDFDRFLEWAGCWKVLSKDKVVPWVVRMGGPAVVREFLRAYFECDGHVEAEGCRVEVTSASRELLSGVQKLLLGFGVPSSLTVKNGRYKGERVSHWRLRVDRQFVPSFEERVGFISSRKALELRACVRALGRSTRNTNKYTVPVNSLIREVSRCLPGRLTRFAHYVNGDRRPSPQMVSAFLEAAEAAGTAPEPLLMALRAAIRPGLYWAPVEEVVSAGIRSVYDITVPEEHAFIGNGIACHNTIFSLGLIHAMQVPTLIVVHKEFLSEQWVERIQGNPEKKLLPTLPNAKIGFVQGDTCDYRGKHIVIGMVHSLSKRRYDADFYKWPGLVITDECHRIGAASWSVVPSKFRARWRLGVTATPRRKDGCERVFRDHIGDTLFVASEQRLPFKVRRVWTEYKPPKSAGLGSSLSGRPLLLTFLCANEPRNKVIVSQLIQAVRAGRKVIVLSERLDHLDRMEKLLRELWESGFGPHPSVGYYVGGMSTEERAVAEKKQVIFATYQYAAEGLDIPALDTLLLASPYSDIEQSVGRIQRPSSGKKDPIVVDFRDDRISAFRRQGLRREEFYKRSGVILGDQTPPGP